MRLIISIIILLILLKWLDKPLPFEKQSSHSASPLPGYPTAERAPAQMIPVDLGKAPETIVMDPNPFAAFTR